MAELIESEAAKPFDAIRANPAVRQGLLLVAIAASVAIGTIGALWSREPNMSLLYASLAQDDAASIVQSLQAAGIEYQLDAAGQSVMVPAKKVHDARLHLAGEGLPQTGGVGLELMREDPGFGVSQFMETARYHHALETELSRSIVRLAAVKDARVHLALARQSVFVRDRIPSSASVLLSVHPGRRMQADQVSAIVHLVASSVPEMDPDQVTVIDQQGRLLNSPGENDDYALSAAQFEHRKRVEDSYARSIEDLLAPVLGFGRVRAKVVADLDFTISEQTQESFDPDRVAVRSEQTSFEERTGEREPAGIPGALSNQPPVAGNPAQQNFAETDRPVNRSRNDVRNFEVDRTVSHTRRATGEVRRLSVAVLVDETPVVASDGTSSGGPLEPADIERLTALVKEAVGFDDARGDTIQLVNTSFRGAGAPDGIEPLKFWELPLFRDLVRQGFGVLLAIAVIFGLLRPAVRSLVQPPAMQAQLAGAGAPAALALPPGETDETRALPPELTAPDAERPGKPSFDDAVAAARAIAGNDPKRVAQVERQWVAENG